MEDGHQLNWPKILESAWSPIQDELSHCLVALNWSDKLNVPYQFTYRRTRFGWVRARILSGSFDNTPPWCTSVFIGAMMCVCRGLDLGARWLVK